MAKITIEQWLYDPLERRAFYQGREVLGAVDQSGGVYDGIWRIWVDGVEECIEVGNKYVVLDLADDELSEETQPVPPLTREDVVEEAIREDNERDAAFKRLIDAGTENARKIADLRAETKTYLHRAISRCMRRIAIQKRRYVILLEIDKPISFVITPLGGKWLNGNA